MPMLIGNFEKGGTFTQGYNDGGNVVPLTNPLHTDSAWGIGGGFVYDLHFGRATSAIGWRYGLCSAKAPPPSRLAMISVC